MAIAMMAAAMNAEMMAVMKAVATRETTNATGEEAMTKAVAAITKGSR